MVQLALFAALLAAAPACALQWTDIEATGALPLPSIAERFSPPKPTPAPDAPYDLLRRGAVRRATGETITAFSAPDATCGFFDGRAGESMLPALHPVWQMERELDYAEGVWMVG